MESFISFMVTFAVAIPVSAAAAVFLARIGRNMRRLRTADADPGEKRTRGFMGAAASLVTLSALPPVLFLASRGSAAAESAVIVSAVFIVPLSMFAIAALAAALRVVLSAGVKNRSNNNKSFRG